jgi:hypothetical protein
MMAISRLRWGFLESWEEDCALAVFLSVVHCGSTQGKKYKRYRRTDDPYPQAGKFEIFIFYILKYLLFLPWKSSGFERSMAEDSADTPRSSHRAIEYNHGSHQLKNRPKSIKPTNCDMPTNFYHPNNLPISRGLAARYRGRQRLSQETRFHRLSTVS